MAVDPRKLKAGDLLVAPDAQGTWGASLSFEGVDAQTGLVFVRELGGDRQLYRASADVLMVPRVVGLAGEDAGDAGSADAAGGSHDAAGKGDGITPEQRRKLFALAKRRGLDVEDVRQMAPAGSVSQLTRVEASRLIDRLQGVEPGHQPHERQGSATGRQLGLIDHLAGELGMSDAELAEWMGKRFGVESVAAIQDGGLAHRIIGGLRCMTANRNKARGLG